MDDLTISSQTHREDKVKPPLESDLVSPGLLSAPAERVQMRRVSVWYVFIELFLIIIIRDDCEHLRVVQIHFRLDRVHLDGQDLKKTPTLKI